jgi:hypothetical protein
MDCAKPLIKVVKLGVEHVFVKSVRTIHGGQSFGHCITKTVREVVILCGFLMAAVGKSEVPRRNSGCEEQY